MMFQVRFGAWRRSPGATIVFLAVLAPMLTVPALRHLIIDAHGGTPALLQWFVTVGMLGGVLGAPLLARHADHRGHHLKLAAELALLDAIISALTLSPLPAVALFALRPLHGAASLSILSLLLARFRGSSSELVSKAGAAGIAALALGPALGGAVTKLGSELPFLGSALVSLLLSARLAVCSDMAEPRVSPPASESRPAPWQLLRAFLPPLLLVATQRFAIGGLVVTLALHLRGKHGFSDARVGVCFSTLLVVFALATWWLGRELATKRCVLRVQLGAFVFAAALVYLGFASAIGTILALAVAGLGAALVYAPCLALIAERAPDAQRASALAMFHAAGGVGMLLGPLGALLLDRTLRTSAPQLGTEAFMLLAGSVQVASALLVAPRLRRVAAPTNQQPLILRLPADRHA